MQQRPVRVWDLFIRLFHWSLVVLFVIAYFAVDEGNMLHQYAGYAILVLILARVVWGFVGTRHARFSDFLRSPGAALRYLRNLPTGSAPRYLGHNPAAGWMMVLLLITLLATGMSGVVVLGLEGEGPLAGGIDANGWVVSVATPWAEAETDGNADEDRESDHDEEEADEGESGEHDPERAGSSPTLATAGIGIEAAEEVWEDWHETLANLMALLVLLHLAGVLVSSVVHRENLAWAMVTGRKRAS